MRSETEKERRYRRALEEIIRHHTALNRMRNRPIERSKTILIAKTALKS